MVLSQPSDLGKSMEGEEISVLAAGSKQIRYRMGAGLAFAVATKSKLFPKPDLMAWIHADIALAILLLQVQVDFSVAHRLTARYGKKCSLSSGDFQDSFPPPLS